MYKVIQPLTRRPELPVAQFTRAWIARTDEGRPAGMLRHVHNRPVAGDSPIENAATSPFDGVDELWFESAAAAAVYFASAFYREHWLEPRRQLLADPDPVGVSGTPHMLVENGEAAGAQTGVKLIILPRRRPDLSLQQFSDHWINKHVPLALKGPGTRDRLARMEVCPAAGVSLPGLNTAVFDGASAIRFKSAQALQEEFQSDYYRDVLAPDEPRFTDASASCSLMVEEVPMFAR